MYCYQHVCSTPCNTKQVDFFIFFYFIEFQFYLSHCVALRSNLNMTDKGTPTTTAPDMILFPSVAQGILTPGMLPSASTRNYNMYMMPASPWSPATRRSVAPAIIPCPLWYIVMQLTLPHTWTNCNGGHFYASLTRTLNECYRDLGSIITFPAS